MVARMEDELIDQAEAVIEVLQMAASQAARVKQMMREQHLSFGLELNHMDDDIAQIIKKVQYMKRLAERWR